MHPYPWQSQYLLVLGLLHIHMPKPSPKGSLHKKSLVTWCYFLGNGLLSPPEGIQASPPKTVAWFPTLVLLLQCPQSPLMFRKSFKTDKMLDMVTAHKQTWRLSENKLYTNYTHSRYRFSPCTWTSSHWIILSWLFSKCTLFSTLAGTETSVCLLGHEGPQNSCLGLVLIPWILAATTAKISKSPQTLPIQVTWLLMSTQGCRVLKASGVFYTCHSASRF